MNTLNFPDVNVWIALAWRRHVHADRAREWFESVAEQRFFFCRITQLAFLRLLTTEAVLGEDAHTMSSAWRLLDKLQSDERIAFLAEPVDVERQFRSQSNLASRSPKLWADAYLLAFAEATGTKLITFDRALKSRGAEVLVL
jgi:uncharacterized protein